MIVYQADKRQFLRDNDAKEIDEVIHFQFKRVTSWWTHSRPQR